MFAFWTWSSILTHRWCLTFAINSLSFFVTGWSPLGVPFASNFPKQNHQSNFKLPLPITHLNLDSIYRNKNLKYVNLKEFYSSSRRLALNEDISNNLAKSHLWNTDAHLAKKKKQKIFFTTQYFTSTKENRPLSLNRPGAAAAAAEVNTGYCIFADKH